MVEKYGVIKLLWEKQHFPFIQIDKLQSNYWSLCAKYFYYTHHTKKLLGGIFVSLHPSVHPSGGIFVSLHPSIHPSVPHTVSALLRLQFWLDPFHIYTSYQATSEGVPCVKLLAKFQNLNFWQIYKICNYDFVLFWLGIWCESLV